jgi:catechol 2,3-dioxygenase-like lactoylglutathione lyase family enzyme
MAAEPRRPAMLGDPTTSGSEARMNPVRRIRPFLPASDFARAKRFYTQLGFELGWEGEGLALMERDQQGFYLQDFNEPAFIGNYQMHMMVADVDVFWLDIQALIQAFGVRAEAPADRPWGLRDLVLFDPSGVLWRIAEAPAAAAG